MRWIHEYISCHVTKKRNAKYTVHLQGGPLRSLVVNGGTWGPYLWPLKMGNWGYFTPINGVISPNPKTNWFSGAPPVVFVDTHIGNNSGSRRGGKSPCIPNSSPLNLARHDRRTWCLEGNHGHAPRKWTKHPNPLDTILLLVASCPLVAFYSIACCPMFTAIWQATFLTKTVLPAFWPSYITEQVL